MRSLDARLIDFVAERKSCRQGAGDDGALLCELANAIADSMSHWGRIMARVEVIPPSIFDSALAGALAIECVFDGLLDGPSLAVLKAAFELATSPA